jgi:hypothetical protein
MARALWGEKLSGTVECVSATKPPTTGKEKVIIKAIHRTYLGVACMHWLEFLERPTINLKIKYL